MLFLSFFLCVTTSVAMGNITAEQEPPLLLSEPPPLLLVSFDGFRADYLRRFPMPNLELLYSQGVLVEELTNVFVTKTFPNHYSLVTGLYPESHGIVASHMYDPLSGDYFPDSADKNEAFWWSEAEPLWITALDSGYKTAAMMWPGSHISYKNRTATNSVSYDSQVTFQQRLMNLTQWILGNEEEPGVKFAALYWEEPDRTGHQYGPDNEKAMAKILKEVDDNVGLIVTELKRTGLWGHINVLVTSDHGMAQCSPDRVIHLDDCLHPDNYTLVDITPVAALIPREDAQMVFDLLNHCHAHMTAYMKENIPDRLHYRNNRRIQPIILIADEGWTILHNGNKFRLGDHGYDNSLPSMHPFMAATGPSFRRGYRQSSLNSVDIYPLMCHLLSVPPRPNNGSLTQALSLLDTQRRQLDTSLVFTLTVGIVLILFTIPLLFRWLRSYRQSGSRAFHRLECYEDEELLYQ